MSTYVEAFGVRNINRLVTLFQNNEGNKVGQGLFRPDSNGDAENFEWDEIRYAQTLAPIGAPDTPSKTLVEMTRARKITPLAYIKVNKKVKGRRIFLTDRGPGQMKADAPGAVAREIYDAKVQIEKTMEYFAINALLGSVVVNSTNIPNSDVTFTLTFSVQTFSYTVSWALASTSIGSDPNELPLAKTNFMLTANFPLKTLLFNQSVTNMFIGNDEVREWFERTLPGVQIAEEGALKRFSAVDLVQYDGFYKTSGGTATKFIPDKRAIGLPEKQNIDEYCVMGLGRGIIPQKAIGMESDMLMGVAPQPGWYGYTTLEDDPVVLKIVIGNIFLPIVTFPSAIMNLLLAP